MRPGRGPEVPLECPVDEQPHMRRNHPLLDRDCLEEVAAGSGSVCDNPGDRAAGGALEGIVSAGAQKPLWSPAPPQSFHEQEASVTVLM